MARRKNQEKKAWEWALKTEPKDVQRSHVNQAFRVNLKPCAPGTCKKNCRSNPNCLQHLGESRWLGSPTTDDSDNFDEQVREEGGFAGLRNLGATCYANTLLQVWYHNPIFRWAVFSYQGAVHPTPSERGTIAPPLPPSPHSPSSFVTPTRPNSTRVEGDTSPKRRRIEPSKANEPDTCVTTDLPVESVMTSCDAAVNTASESEGRSASQSGTGEREGGSAVADMAVVVGHLQLLFAKMQYSKGSSVDPVDFINSLDLDPNVQQDVQEFLRLFLPLLESAFQSQESPVLRSLMQQQFSGTYAYVTRCEGCGATSAMDSQYYELELNIKGHKLLQDCLNEFFQQESLSGNNQYFCSSCGSKQDAKRFIQLKTVPPVLTLQLMRFVFDMSLLAKVKVTSYLVFPDTIDMSAYTGSSSVIYKLRAVIVHCGPSAYSGHYTVHVRDVKNNCWYRFDDQIVEKIESDKLVLVNQDDLYGASTPGRKPKCPKNHHISNNAYMLVYESAGLFAAIPDPVAPPEVREMVSAENSAFEQFLNESRKIKAATVFEERLRQEEMGQLYQGLAVKPGIEDYEWLRTSWLVTVLSGEEPGRCEHEALLCPHGKLAPDRVVELKRISRSSVQELYHKYSMDSLRLSSDMLCRQCVVQRCSELRLEEKITADQKTINSLLRTPCTSSSGFWVGRKTLQCWKKLYLQSRGGCTSSSPSNADSSEYEVQSRMSAVPCLEHHVGPTADSRGESPHTQNCRPAPAVIVLSSDGEEEMLGRSARKRTSGFGVVAPALVVAPPHGTEEQPSEDPEPTDCNSTASSLDTPPPAGGVCRVAVPEVPTAIVTGEPISVSHATSASREAECCAGQCPGTEGAETAKSMAAPIKFNGDLLCSHGELCEGERQRRLVPEEVWRLLVGYFPGMRSFPALHQPCPLCKQCRLQEEERVEMLRAVAQAQKSELLDLYHNRNRPLPSSALPELYVIPAAFVDDWMLFVRYQGRHEQPTSLAISSLLCEHGGFPFNVTEDTWSDFSDDLTLVWPTEWFTLMQWYSNDAQISLLCTQLETEVQVVESTPSFCAECCHQRAAFANVEEEEKEEETGYIYVYQSEVDAESLCVVKEEPSVSTMMATPSRSLRRRIPVGAKKMKVSRNQTLQMLKLDVMYQFQVPPLEQHLFCNGCELSDGEKRLLELGVTPGCTVLLKVDSQEEVYEKFIRETAAAASKDVEDGFKGTGLLQ